LLFTKNAVDIKIIAQVKIRKNMSDTYQIYYHHKKPHLAFEILESAQATYPECSIRQKFDEFQCDVYVLFDDPLSNIIAIDWDNTFTAQPEFYYSLIHAYLNAGFEPIICTLRGQDHDDINDICTALATEKIRVFPTDGQLKRRYMQQKGISINLWIDDFFPCIASCDSDFIINNGIDY
jgi:hypothetical protein